MTIAAMCLMSQFLSKYKWRTRVTSIREILSVCVAIFILFHSTMLPHSSENITPSNIIFCQHAVLSVRKIYGRDFNGFH
jgi:hypothetical protein